MSRTLRALIPLILIVGLGACGSTKFISTWKEPSVRPAELVGKRIATFVISEDARVRRAAEDALAVEITARGAQGISGQVIAPGNEAKDRDKLKQKLQNLNINSVVVLRAVKKDEEIKYVPGRAWYHAPAYSSFYGYWGHSWGIVVEPGHLDTDTVLTVETLIYSVDTDKLVWAGQSQTTNPEYISTFIPELAKAIDDELKKSGLLK